MAFPIEPPLDPMLAKLARALPREGDWLFEPKWDGFRVLIFRDGDELYLQSRAGKPLLRYFPEVAEPLLAALPDRAVADGELVVARASGPEDPVTLDFTALQMRLHPAESRIHLLAEETPASVILWDLLAEGDATLLDAPFETRRARLEATVGARARPPVFVTPATRDAAVAQTWFERFEGAGLDGLIAKDPTAPYLSGKRAMLKIKHERTADCVVGGFRWHKRAPGEEVGSLVLGLWDEGGRLQQIGIASGFSAAQRRTMAATLGPEAEAVDDDHPWLAWEREHAVAGRVPGAQSRWSAGKDLSWVPVPLGRVAEVAFNQLTDGRFRHPAKFVRWRPDKGVDDCRFDQLEIVAPIELARVFRPASGASG